MERFTCEKVRLDFQGDPHKRPVRIIGRLKVLKPYCKGMTQEDIDTFNEQMHNSAIALFKIGYQYELEDVVVSEDANGKQRKLPFFVEKGKMPKPELNKLLAEANKDEHLLHLQNQLKELGAEVRSKKEKPAKEETKIEEKTD